MVFYCINVTVALAAVLSVGLCLVPFWTTQPSYREYHPTGFKLWVWWKVVPKMQIHSMEGDLTHAYFGSTWSPHLPQVCGTRDSNSGLNLTRTRILKICWYFRNFDSDLWLTQISFILDSWIFWTLTPNSEKLLRTHLFICIVYNAHFCKRDCLVPQ